MKLKFPSNATIKKSQGNSRYFPRLLDGRDTEVKKLYNSNLTIHQIAAKLNVSVTILYEKIEAMKLEQRTPRFRVKKLGVNHFFYVILSNQNLLVE